MYVNFKIILCLVSKKIVFLSEVIWNIKLDVYIVYVVRMAHDMSRLKLTWIDSRFMPVWRPIPFERALNSIQHMWIWQTSYVQQWRKLYFILKLFNKGTADEYDMFTSGCISSLNHSCSPRLNRQLTECGAYFTLVHNNQQLTCRNAGVSGVKFKKNLSWKALVPVHFQRARLRCIAQYISWLYTCVLLLHTLLCNITPRYAKLHSIIIEVGVYFMLRCVI